MGLSSRFVRNHCTKTRRPDLAILFLFPRSSNNQLELGIASGVSCAVGMIDGRNMQRRGGQVCVKSLFTLHMYFGELSQMQIILKNAVFLNQVVKNNSCIFLFTTQDMVSWFLEGLRLLRFRFRARQHFLEFEKYGEIQQSVFPRCQVLRSLPPSRRTNFLFCPYHRSRRILPNNLKEVYETKED